MRCGVPDPQKSKMARSETPPLHSSTQSQNQDPNQKRRGNPETPHSASRRSPSGWPPTRPPTRPRRRVDRRRGPGDPGQPEVHRAPGTRPPPHPRRPPLPPHADAWPRIPAPVREPIIDLDTWKEAQDTGAEHASSHDNHDDAGPNPADRVHPYRGRVRCADCKKRMSAHAYPAHVPFPMPTSAASVPGQRQQVRQQRLRGDNAPLGTLQSSDHQPPVSEQIRRLSRVASGLSR